MQVQAERTDPAAGPDALPFRGSPDAPILVVCDIPTKKAWDARTPIEGQQLRLFGSVMSEYGLEREDFAFVSPCPPIPDEIAGSASKEGKFTDQYRAAVLAVVARHKPKMVVYMGATAGRQLSGRQVKITRARGQMHSYDAVPCPVVAMLSTGHVLRRPEMGEIFRTDALLIKRVKDSGYATDAVAQSVEIEENYFWCTDLTAILAERPTAIAVDTEGTGLRWYNKDVDVLTVQLTWKAGTSAVIPVHCGYYPALTRRRRAIIIQQLKQLLEDPEVIVAGHNLKYDVHMLREKLGIRVANPVVDTQLLAFAADDNMQEKSLDECTRRWVPAMAGYADEFNAETDKSRMIDVPHDKMLRYAGGDTDACFRLANVLLDVVQADEKQWNIYQRVQMPAILAFQDFVEPEGLDINTDELTNLQVALDARSKELHTELMRMVPAAVKRKHMEKGLKFSRPEFVRDILFSKEGLNLKPVKFTKTTERLKGDERIPSTSAKDHLPYFEDEPFVAMFMEYTKVEKMRGTYVGLPSDPDKGGAPSGFWKYILDGKIHPSYMLHRTNTGRTASSDPNGQNFPKRGALAMAYRKIFVAPPGYVLLETDLSQAELRIAAWMAGELNMINIYREGGDIHAATAAETMGITYAEYKVYAKDETPLLDTANRFAGASSWLAQQDRAKRATVTVKEFMKAKRQQAKAINFGFLYGMGWRKFMSYAKTDYGVTFTEDEAKEVRKTFFRKYPRLAKWHETMRGFVREYGYVRSLHGALRRLPSIYSNDEGVVSGAERNAINSPVQRFASDLGLIALARIVRDAPADMVKPVAFIHDALVCLVKEEYAHELAGNIKWYMETPPLEQWFGIKAPLPIQSDCSLGANLGEMEEYPDIEAKQPEWAQAHLDV